MTILLAVSQIGLYVGHGMSGVVVLALIIYAIKLACGFSIILTNRQ